MTNHASVHKRLSDPFSMLAIIALLAIGWFVYRPALSGTFLLDDLPNLSDLASVTDTASAVYFALAGTSGPLGRPIALASFLPHASAWGSDAEPFIRTNILIHLLNGLLLFGFARQLGRMTRTDKRDIQLLALGVSALWVFMPLLASSSLLIVQRMTTLSATFVLAGLNAYIFARRQIDAKPDGSLVAMSISLVIASLLAAFTKENGALLPVFVLVLEATLLDPPRSVATTRWRVWRSLFLVAPTVLILVYLVSRVPYGETIIAKRDFTASERLFSEARILWEYLFNAFIPRMNQLGPFHETRQARELFSDPLTLAAVTAWILVVALAVKWRRVYPVATFAILWFIAGHLLESTTIPLELYFEHRNYLPIIGPVFAICFAVFRYTGRYRFASRAALAAYAVVNAFVLYGVASMWGTPLFAAAFWYKHNPDSVRAATTLAAQQLSRAGPDLAIRTLRDFAGRNPEHAYIRIPELNLLCQTAPVESHSELVGYLESALPSVAFSNAPGEMLDQLLTTSTDTNCADVDPSVVAELAAAVMENPRFNANIRYNQFHHTLMARIARISGDTDATLEHLARAMEVLPTDDLNMMTVSALVDAGRYDDARQFIDDAAQKLPRQPLKRYNSAKNLDELSTYVNELEKLAGDQPGPGNGD
jgi:hypothetical protein